MRKKTQTTKIATSVCTFYKKPEDCEGENLAIASTTTSGYCEMGEPENVKTMNPSISKVCDFTKMQGPENVKTVNPSMSVMGDFTETQNPENVKAVNP